MIDYRLWMDDSQGGGFVVQEETLTGLAHTVTGLNKGQLYSFKVEVRNVYGYSAFSNTVSILASQEPT